MTNLFLTQLFTVIQHPRYYCATKYLSPHYVVKVTRKRHGGKLLRRQRSETFLVTIGVPNYAERQFIKMCQQTKERFPVKNIQVKCVS